MGESGKSLEEGALRGMYGFRKWIRQKQKRKRPSDEASVHCQPGQEFAAARSVQNVRDARDVRHAFSIARLTDDGREDNYPKSGKKVATSVAIDIALNSGPERPIWSVRRVPVVAVLPQRSLLESRDTASLHSLRTLFLLLVTGSPVGASLRARARSWPSSILLP